MDWTQTFVSPTSTLKEVITTIDKAELQVALVVDDQKHLLGLITDGDVRRGFLNGLSLEADATAIMTRNPVTVSPEMRATAIEHLMKMRDIHHIPVVDSDDVVVSLAVRGKLLPKEQFDNEVILMAGGLGTRLGDLTKDIPKPLLKVANKPILEIIIEGFLAQGFRNFTIAVNYKAELIKSYFGNGKAWGANIKYIQEGKRLGTCGALSLLEQKPSKPFIVMNGDVLTKVNFQQLLEFHSERTSCATMAIREYDVQVPFGVIDLDGYQITSLTEKPTQRFFVNAGIYALNPSVLDFIPANAFFDMTSLFQALLNEQKHVSSFPIYEYWLDIGRTSDFQKAHIDFSEQWANPELNLS